MDFTNSIKELLALALPLSTSLAGKKLNSSFNVRIELLVTEGLLASHRTQEAAGHLSKIKLEELTTTDELQRFVSYWSIIHFEEYQDEEEFLKILEANKENKALRSTVVAGYIDEIDKKKELGTRIMETSFPGSKKMDWRKQNENPSTNLLEQARRWRKTGDFTASLQAYRSLEDLFPDFFSVEMEDEKREVREITEGGRDFDTLKEFIIKKRVGNVEKFAKAIERSRNLPTLPNKKELLCKIYLAIIDKDQKVVELASRAKGLFPDDPDVAAAIIISDIEFLRLEGELPHRGRRAQEAREVLEKYIDNPIGPSEKHYLRAGLSVIGQYLHDGKAGVATWRAHTEARLYPKERVLKPYTQTQVKRARVLQKDTRAPHDNHSTAQIENAVEKGDFEEAIQLLPIFFARGYPIKRVTINQLLRFVLEKGDEATAELILNSRGSLVDEELARVIQEKIHRGREKRVERSGIKTSPVMTDFATRRPVNKQAALGSSGMPDLRWSKGKK